MIGLSNDERHYGILIKNISETPVSEEPDDSQQQPFDGSELMTAVPLDESNQDHSYDQDSDQLLSQAVAPVEPNFSGDAQQQYVEDVMPVLDISDPAQLLQLMSTGDLFMEAFDLPDLPEINPENRHENEELVSHAIEDIFLPPKIQSREPANSKVMKRKSHTILTSEEIVNQKRQQLLIKAEKEAKKSKKTKKSNV